MTIYGYRCSQLVALVLGVFGLSGGHVVWGAPHEGADHTYAEGQATTEIGKGLVLPEIQGPKPWSDKPALTDPDRFSIAIMTDRTGGHRPGIWMKAVERINWLRPDFVVSVGDLIEGYTEDDAEIAAQWREFLGFIDQLQMKFFFVAGNHDVTNPKLHRIWRKHFGREWYSFDYHGVHFVCLSSEDPTTHLGDEQLEWLEQDLSKNKQARWTLVFLHKPLWVSAERDVAAGNADSTNWNRVAQLLGDRPHTVFAGHVHHYVQYQRNGTQYYSLATTGGSSRMRGVAYGEFDHVTWLTMERDGPHVANLLLDGIQPASVVTEESIQRFRAFLQQVRIEVAPILIRGTELQTGDIRIRLQNDFDSDVRVRATIDGLPLVGLTMDSMQLQMEAAAGSAVEQVVRFEMKQPVDLPRFAGTTLTGIVESNDSPPLRAEWSVPVIIDHEYQIRRQTVDLDGSLEDWSGEWWSTEANPLLTGPTQQWTGADDAGFQIATAYDDQYLYFAAKVTDERVTSGDGLSLIIDPRSLLNRINQGWLGRDTIGFSVAAPSSNQVEDCRVQRVSSLAARRVEARGRRTATGYEFEARTPIRPLVETQGEDWSSFQFGARLADVDSAEEPAVEVLWRAAVEIGLNRPFAQVLRANEQN